MGPTRAALHKRSQLFKSSKIKGKTTLHVANAASVPHVYKIFGTRRQRTARKAHAPQSVSASLRMTTVAALQLYCVFGVCALYN